MVQRGGAVVRCCRSGTDVSSVEVVQRIGAGEGSRGAGVCAGAGAPGVGVGVGAGVGSGAEVQWCRGTTVVQRFKGAKGGLEEVQRCTGSEVQQRCSRGASLHSSKLKTLDLGDNGGARMVRSGGECYLDIDPTEMLADGDVDDDLIRSFADTLTGNHQSQLRSIASRLQCFRDWLHCSGQCPL